jgi:hypothetical protein
VRGKGGVMFDQIITAKMVGMTLSDALMVARTDKIEKIIESLRVAGVNTVEELEALNNSEVIK